MYFTYEFTDYDNGSKSPQSSLVGFFVVLPAFQDCAGVDGVRIFPIIGGVIGKVPCGAIAGRAIL